MTTGHDSLLLPALEPPAGVELQIGWMVAAMYWRAHTPADAAGRCGRCQLAWPCWSNRFADAFLDSAVMTGRRSDLISRPTEPIPTVRTVEHATDAAHR